MLMNRVERAAVSLPGRGYLQRWFEAPRMLTMGGHVAGGDALEVGCGNGTGTEVILELFKARHVDAFDLDDILVKKAIRRLAKYGERVSVCQGDVTSINTVDASYDAVFDFAIIHHVPDWERALKEVYRVLKPGGRFYAEEVFDKFILHPLFSHIFQHPQENRFNHQQFILGLENAGFTIVDSNQLWGYFGWFVADKPGA